MAIKRQKQFPEEMGRNLKIKRRKGSTSDKGKQFLESSWGCQISSVIDQTEKARNTLKLEKKDMTR